MISTPIDFPAGLPYPQREGRDTNHISPFTRPRMQSGRGRPRRAFTSVPSAVTVTWLFRSDAQAAFFEVWFKRTLNDGVEWFNCPLRTPLGAKPYVCRFTDMYKGPTLTGVSMWKISAVLEIYERPLLPDEYADYPEYMLDANILDRTMNQYWPK